MPHSTLHLLISFLLAIVLVHALNPIAVRIGLLDRPSGRKLHDQLVPATGGLAMFGGFFLAAALLEPPVAPRWDLMVGLLWLVGLGVADDLLDLRPWTKLAGQVAIVLAMVVPGHLLVGPGEMLGLGHLHAAPLLDVVVTTLFAVGVINAFNMLDGLDGLAGGTAAATLAWLAATAALLGMAGTLMHALLLLAAVLGFLTFNARHPWRRSASVFMGDAGSMMLGAAVAFLMLDLSVGSGKRSSLPALLWLVAVPVFDTIILIARRFAAGQSPLCGDRRHVHHFLLQAGFSPQTATSLLVAVSFLYGGIGMVGLCLAVPDLMMLLALLVPFAAHVYFVLHGWRVIEHIRALQGIQHPAAEPLAQPGLGLP